MKINSKAKILSLKLGTKNLAVSILENDNLIYWANKFIRNKKMSEKLILKRAENIISKLIDFYQPKIIVVGKLSYPQTIKHRILNELVKEIKKLAGRYKLKIYSFTSLSARNFICQKEKPTKLNTARIISSYYPWLFKEYKKEKDKSWFREKPKLRIFEAIALGRYCLYKLRYA